MAPVSRRPDVRRRRAWPAGAGRVVFAALAGLAAGLSGACGGGASSPAGDAGADTGNDGGADDEWSKCVWNGTTSMLTPDVTLTANNSADLTGAPLGGATPDFAAQRKTITVIAENLAPELAVRDGYLWRNTPTTESAYLVVAVTNVSDHVVCSVIGTNYRWLGADGAVAMMGQQIYVNGSVATRESGDFSDTCPGAGEKGTFTDVQVPGGAVPLFSTTAAVAFGLAGPFSTGTPPPGKLVPQAYDVGTCGSMPAVKVSLTNTGAGDVALEKFSLSPAGLVDDPGLPAGRPYLQAGPKTAGAARGS